MGRRFHCQCSKSTAAFVEALATDADLEMAQGVTDADKLFNVSPTEAQRRFKDLQIVQQVNERWRKSTQPGLPPGAMEAYLKRKKGSASK